MLPNSEELEAAGITVRKFCGMPVAKIDEDHFVACDKEATGELTFVVALDPDDIMVDGSKEIPVNVPVCDGCLKELNKGGKYSIAELDNPGGILLD